MANNYSLASFVVPCGKDDGEVLLDMLAEEDEEGYGHSYEAEYDDGGVWITDNGEWIDADWIADCIHRWLAKRDAPDLVMFELAYTCSKPRVGEFGGAIYFATRERWGATGTGPILHQCMTDAMNIDRYFD